MFAEVSLILYGQNGLRLERRFTARLTEQEKQEIMRYLGADKPLPDYYRFLLFEEKRKVQLVWNGKTNEVCNIVLPFQTIEQVDEPRSEKELKLQPDLFDVSSGRYKITVKVVDIFGNDTMKIIEITV